MPTISLSSSLPVRAWLATRFCAAVAALPLAAAAASLNVYVSAPGDQATFVNGATTEKFNNLPVGIDTTTFQSAIGTYQFSPSNPVAVMAADQYGGANGSRYIAVGVESNSTAPVTLNLATPANYFGFWWSAGDANNGLSFYYNNTFITRLTTADIINVLGGPAGRVTAVNGVTYNSSSYYGNPNTGGDSVEPFAYVDVFAKNTGFNRIVFDNSGQITTGFETDNQSATLANLKPQGSSVFIESVPALAVLISPEPALLAIFGCACFAVVFLIYQWRNSKGPRSLKQS